MGQGLLIHRWMPPALWWLMADSAEPSYRLQVFLGDKRIKYSLRLFCGGCFYLFFIQGRFLKIGILVIHTHAHTHNRDGDVGVRRFLSLGGISFCIKQVRWLELRAGSALQIKQQPSSLLLIHFPPNPRSVTVLDSSWPENLGGELSYSAMQPSPRSCNFQS